MTILHHLLLVCVLLEIDWGNQTLNHEGFCAVAGTKSTLLETLIMVKQTMHKHACACVYVTLDCFAFTICGNIMLLAGTRVGR